MPNILIGIAGAARSGKDTLARAIADFVPRTEIYSFAYAVKLEADPVCRSNLGVSAFEEDTEKKKIIRQTFVGVS